MQSSKKVIIRVLLFVLIFCVLCSACEFFLLKFEGNGYVTMHDLAKEKDLDVVVIGNSEAFCHFDPFLFQELTGKNSFNLSRTSSTIVTQYFLMEEMFQNHKPEKVIVFFDPTTLRNAEESSVVQAMVWPYLSNPLRRIEYALTLAATDDNYIDRLFPWRLYMPETADDLMLNVQNKIDDLKGNDNYYDYAYGRLNGAKKSYSGKGFGPWKADLVTTMEEVNKFCQRTYSKREFLIHEDVQELIRKMDELCRKNDCELIAVSIPRLPGDAMANLLNVYDAQAQFFAELDVPYWNFCYAKEHVMPRMDVSYYYDRTHMTCAGADILTESLANVFNAYQRSEDVTDKFYTTDEFLASIDYVTNTWLTEKSQGDQTQLTAYANHGTKVVPEYCFAKIDANGCETILQDYSTENVCLTKLEEGEKIRLYTRNASNLEQSPLCFEFE